jgi:hypothetical protein
MVSAAMDVASLAFSPGESDTSFDSGAQAPSKPQPGSDGAALGAKAVPPGTARSRVPAAPVQEELREEIDRLYPLAAATTAPARQALARKLIGLGREEGDAARKFVLLRRAMDLASQSGDAKVMMIAVDAIARDFDIQALQVKEKMLSTCCGRISDPDQAANFLDQVDRGIEEALAARDYDLATRLLQLEARIPARSAGRVLRDRIAERRAEVTELSRAAREFDESRATLKVDPDSPAANLRAGRWHCFYGESWQDGLPLLSKTGNRKLKALADRELRSPSREPAGQVDLAEQWWKLSQGEDRAGKAAAMRRAGYWYTQARPGLQPGPTRDRVDEHLGQIAAIAPPILVRGIKPAALATDAACYICAKRGDDANPGTRQHPWKTIGHATRTVRPGNTVVILPGVYRAQRFDFGPGGADLQHRTVFKFAYFDNYGGRAVLTGPKDQSPDFALAPNTRIEGLWIGGNLPEDPKGTVNGYTNQAGLEVVRCAVWASRRGRDGHMYGLLCGNTAVNMLMADNLFVHLGGHWFDHAIYISGGPPPTTQDCRFVGNVFVEGGGFAMHCWHEPKHITMIGNFISGHTCGMVAQGPGHIIHHNVVWKPHGKPDDPGMNIAAMLPNDLLRFDHNLLVSTRPIDGKGKPSSPPVENYIVAGPQGTQVNLIPLLPARLPQVSWVGQTAEQIDAAISEVDRYFSQLTPQQIAEDTSAKVENALKVLRVKYTPSTQDLSSRPVK